MSYEDSSEYSECNNCSRDFKRGQTVYNMGKQLSYRENFFVCYKCSHDSNAYHPSNYMVAEQDPWTVKESFPFSKALTVTREIAEKVAEVVDAGLVVGAGVPIQGQMCVEAAVCYAMNLPHDDKPLCVAPVIRQFKIALNDKSEWGTNELRGSGMKRAAIAQLGSNTIDEDRWVTELIAQINKNVVPFFSEDNANDWSGYSINNSLLHIDAKSEDLTSFLEDTTFTEVILGKLAEACVQACIALKTKGSKWLDLAPLPLPLPLPTPE